MGPVKPAPRSLALARSADHPLSMCVRQAGWLPVPYFCTAMVATGEPPPPGAWDAALILSPGGARAVLPHLGSGTPCFVTGRGTAEALAGAELVPILSPEPRAESLWQELQARFPAGGHFLLVRGERSRGYLETAAEGTPWDLTPWVSHRERVLDPLPALPEVEAVLALSPLQAEVLAPRCGRRLRFAWGERSARAFTAAGVPPTAWCAPTLEALEGLLVSQSPSVGDSPFGGHERLP